MPTSHPDHRPTLHAADGPVLFFQLRRRVVWAAADAGVRRSTTKTMRKDCVSHYQTTRAAACCQSVIRQWALGLAYEKEDISNNDIT